jgi:hypothetical protein
MPSYRRSYLEVIAMALGLGGGLALWLWYILG